MCYYNLFYVCAIKNSIVLDIFSQQGKPSHQIVTLHLALKQQHHLANRHHDPCLGRMFKVKRYPGPLVHMASDATKKVCCGIYHHVS